jgi:hypothetical protein
MNARQNVSGRLTRVQRIVLSKYQRIERVERTPPAAPSIFLAGGLLPNARWGHCCALYAWNGRNQRSWTDFNNMSESEAGQSCVATSPQEALGRRC